MIQFHFLTLPRNRCSAPQNSNIQTMWQISYTYKYLVERQQWDITLSYSLTQLMILPLQELIDVPPITKQYKLKPKMVIRNYANSNRVIFTTACCIMFFDYSISDGFHKENVQGSSTSPIIM